MSCTYIRLRYAGVQPLASRRRPQRCPMLAALPVSSMKTKRSRSKSALPANQSSRRARHGNPAGQFGEFMTWRAGFENCALLDERQTCVGAGRPWKGGRRQQPLFGAAGSRGRRSPLANAVGGRARQNLTTRLDATLKFQLRRDPRRRRRESRFRGRVICDFSSLGSFLGGVHLRVETHPMRIRRF